MVHARSRAETALNGVIEIANMVLQGMIVRVQQILTELVTLTDVQHGVSGAVMVIVRQRVVMENKQKLGVVCMVMTVKVQRQKLVHAMVAHVQHGPNGVITILALNPVE